MSSSNIRSKVLGTPGYDASLRLNALELDMLSRIVFSQYLDAIRNAGIANYGNHAAMFPKSARLLSSFDVAHIKPMRFMDALRDNLGYFSISKVILPDGTQEDREEIYWRIVRPNHPEDVGKLHRDSDFHKQYGIEQGKQTVKCWIPLWCEPLCGLMVIPTDARMEYRDGKYIDPQKWFSEPGTIVLFNQNVEHTGAINTGTSARVSIEMTLVLAE